jgi:hypothetical protein
MQSDYNVAFVYPLTHQMCLRLPFPIVHNLFWKLPCAELGY